MSDKSLIVGSFTGIGIVGLIFVCLFIYTGPKKPEVIKEAEVVSQISSPSAWPIVGVITSSPIPISNKIYGEICLDNKLVEIEELISFFQDDEAFFYDLSSTKKYLPKAIKDNIESGGKCSVIDLNQTTHITRLRKATEAEIAQGLFDDRKLLFIINDNTILNQQRMLCIQYLKNRYKNLKYNEPMNVPVPDLLIYGKSHIWTEWSNEHYSIMVKPMIR